METNLKAFYFMTLSLAARKVMLNVESGDYGVIEKRSCDCPLESWVTRSI